MTIIRIRYCSFCNKKAEDVNWLITGHEPAAICNECVLLCNDIIKTKNAEKVIVEKKQKEK